MNPAQLLAHFDRISEAPDAIPRLRRFFLDLAVRGKLVGQDPNDEPASELLKRIRAEKARLAKEGVRAPLRTTAISVDDQPQFATPHGWVVATLGELVIKITDGTHKTPTYVDEGIPFVSVKDFSGGRLDFSSTRFIRPEEHAMLYKRCDPRRGDILIGRIGTLGKPVLVDTDRQFSLFVSVGLIRFPHDLIAPAFLRLLLNSPHVETEFDRIKIGGGTHTNKLNLGDLHTVVVPLPPLAEQHRIVARVNELMGLCDRLEAMQAEREGRRDWLVVASLRRLNQPAHGSDADGFRDHARFHLRHLPRLTTRPEHIQKFRQTILDLAIRGRLVPHDPNDEPALQRLERIHVEKLGLTRETKAKGRQHLGMSEEADPPFGIPEGWCWATLGQLALGFRYGTSVKCSYKRAGEPVLRIPNLANGRITIDDLKFGPVQAREADALRLQRGDILMVRSNGSLGLVGRPALVDAQVVGYCFAGYLVRVRTSSAHLNAGYLLLALNTTHVRCQIELPIRTTVGLKNVNASELGALTVPLPPLAEQHRIVAKVAEFMVLCDRLEAQLTTTQTEHRRLLEGVLAKALGPAA